MSITLPIVSIQPSFPSVIDDVYNGTIPFDDFWLSCYHRSQSSLHFKVHTILDEKDREAVRLLPKHSDSSTSAKGDVEISSTKSGPSKETRYTVSVQSLGIKDRKIYLPREQYPDRDGHRITAFDVSPDRQQFATGFLDGSVHLYPTDDKSTFVKRKQVNQTLHKSTVTSIRFFPSSRVLLTAGGDFRLNILPADPSPQQKFSPVRTLSGHTRSITSTAIISKGRNILSSSADGSIRLWDVSTSSQIHLFTPANLSPVTNISLGEDGGTLNSSILFCSLQSGGFEAFDLSSNCSIFHSPLDASSSALTTISYSPQSSLLATASSNGVIAIYDTRSLTSPLSSFARNSSSVEDLCFSPSHHNPSLLVSASDALPFLASVSSPEVVAEIVGGDCDAARVVKTRETEIWTASDDGVVRQYDIW